MTCIIITNKLQELLNDISLLLHRYDISERYMTAAGY